MLKNTLYHILPWSEHLLCVSVAHEGAQEGGAKGCHRDQILGEGNLNVVRGSGQALGWAYFGLENVW